MTCGVDTFIAERRAAFRLRDLSVCLSTSTAATPHQRCTINLLLGQQVNLLQFAALRTVQFSTLMLSTNLQNQKNSAVSEITSRSRFATHVDVPRVVVLGAGSFRPSHLRIAVHSICCLDGQKRAFRKKGHARVESRVLKTLACRNGFWTSFKQW